MTATRLAGLLSAVLLVGAAGMPVSHSAPHAPAQSVPVGALVVRESFDVRAITIAGRRGPVLFDSSDGVSDNVRSRPGSTSTFLLDSSDTAELVIEAATPGGASAPLTRHPSFGPAWAPAGLGFAYSRVLGSPLDLAAHPSVLVFRPRWRRRGTERTLTKRRLRTQDTDPAWAPDGRRIAFTRSRELVNGEIWIVDVATGREARVTSGEDSDWSPKGDRLVFVHENDVQVIELATGRIRALTSGKVDAQPLWSPDGRTIAFERLTSDLDTQIRLIPARGGTSRLLVPDGDLLDWPRRALR